VQVVIGERGWFEGLMEGGSVPHAENAGVLDGQADAFFAQLPARDLAIVALQELAELIEPVNRDSYRRNGLNVHRLPAPLCFF